MFDAQFVKANELCVNDMILKCKNVFRITQIYDPSTENEKLIDLAKLHNIVGEKRVLFIGLVLSDDNTWHEEIFMPKKVNLVCKLLTSKKQSL
jgi:hypothetical protein